MDIIFVLKDAQREIVSMIRSLEQGEHSSSPSVAAIYSTLRSKILAYCKLDEEFLFQEISDLFAGSQKAIRFGQSCHRQLIELLEQLDDDTGLLANGDFPKIEFLGKLKEEVEKHFVYQGDYIFHEMREKIPTHEREILVGIYKDVCDEINSRTDGFEDNSFQNQASRLL